MSTTAPAATFSPTPSAVRVRLDLAYDGADFAGWAKQPGLRTVQGELEAGLSRLFGVRREDASLDPRRGGDDGKPAGGLRLVVAGRTDAGVHARGQVAHLDVPETTWRALPGRSDREPGQALVERLAGVLPPDIVVYRATPAPDGFDARFSALARRYAYRIADGYQQRDPRRRGHVLWNRRPLDVAAMNRGVAALLGLRDFAAFCKPRPGATTIRDLKEFTWTRPDDGPDIGLVVGHLVADAFCHNLVRSLVGASLAVGEGRRPAEWLVEVLESQDRQRAAAVVAPHGLTLEQVYYPEDGLLAARAEAVRAVRALSPKHSGVAYS
ncbi:MAG: tRNA pseudouridine(38-40) synthase TruA [Promicromonosporaceae bacterium]|nr:tRNA pseudouridine(38-40) synthase TruA [Promicromonosporaceae bacterium]